MKKILTFVIALLISGLGLNAQNLEENVALASNNGSPKPYRLQSITGENTGNDLDLYYVYSDDGSRVEKITEGSYATLVEYNEDGTVAKTTYVFMWEGAPDYTSNYTVTEYTYTDGVLTSYTETNNYSWGDPETSEYTLTYNEDGNLATVTRSSTNVFGDVTNYERAYEYEDGKLVKETSSFSNDWTNEIEYIKEFEYDENGNCVTETKYNAYNNPPTPQEGVDYFYDLNIPSASVYVFAYPHEVLPARANLVTKAVTYYYNEDWETKEVTKGNFSVKTYNYNEEVISVPVAPINLAANVLSDTEIKLTWETLEEVESFKVYNGTTLVADIEDALYVVEGLEPLTEYSFTVVAVNGELESAASEAVKVTTYDLVNVNPAEIAFGNVIVGDYWVEKTSSVSISIDRFGKEVKAVKTDNRFFRVPAVITLTNETITTTVDYNKNSEAGEYKGNLLVILASGDTVSFPLTATAYTPVTPDVFEHAQAIETVDGVFSDMPDFATLTDDYKLPGEDEDGNRPDAVYSFTLAEEASVEIDVESNSYDGIYAIYKAPFEGNGPSYDNNVEPTDRVYSTAFACDFEDGSLEDFEIQDNDGNLEYTMKVEDGALVSWSYIYDNENYVTVVSYANERAVTKEAYNITEKSVLTFDARFKDGNGYGTYDQVTVQVTKDGETYTDIDWVVNEYDYTTYQYSAEFNTYRVDLGAKFAEKGLEYGEYRVALLYSSWSGSVAIDNIDLSERALVCPAGDYYIVAAASEDFKVTVKSDALPELELNKEAHYRLVSTESELNPIRYNYASKIGTQVVNVNNSGDLDFLKYNDEGLLLGYVSCYVDEATGGIDTISELEYIYEGCFLVGYKEKAAFGPWGQVQEMEYVFHYNADGKIVTVSSEDAGIVTAYTYNEEGQLVEKADGYEYDGEVSFESKEVYTYADGNLVTIGYMALDWESEEPSFYLTEEINYEYDNLGNVVSMKWYTCETDDNDSLIKNLYQGASYVYDYSIAYEDVFYFEYPHHAYSYMSSPAQPSHANIILAEDSYYAYFDNDKEEYVYHTQNRKTYRYEEYTLEGEDTPVAPAAPQNLVATVTNDSTIVLTWDAVEGAECYRIYHFSNSVFSYYETTNNSIAYIYDCVPEKEYCFRVTAINEAGESGFSNMACATIKLPYWIPDPSLYANNMTIISTIAIDGVEQYNTELELGAFCGDELRGSERLQEAAGRYECFLMVYGNSGNNITFKLYDHSTGTVLDLRSNQSVTFEANGTIGDVFNPYVINFKSTVVHTRTLTSGWNWYSTYVVNEGVSGLTQLENAVGENGIQIKNQSKFVNQAGGSWYGTLTSTAVEDMYMIQMSSAADVTLEDYEVNPEEYPIALGTNWKWISYPLSTVISVEEAFASANPSDGDYIKSQTGFAQYYQGLGWSGTLKTMTPGMGYMYQNTSNSIKTLVYPSSHSKGDVKQNVTTYGNHWVADCTKYPMNMTMIAVVEGADNDYEVAAFIDGECRGSARPIYIEALDRYVLFLTIYGDKTEKMTFRYYDVETEDTFSIADEMTFTVNATVGNVMNPYVLTRGTLSLDELSSSFEIYPNPVEDELFLATELRVEEIAIYDIYGRMTTVYGLQTTDFVQSIDIAELEAGVYFVKVVTNEGEIVKRFVKN